MVEPQPGEAAALRPLAVVLLERPPLPEPQAIIAAMRSRHPDVAIEMVDAPPVGQPWGSLVLRCGGELVALLLMPGPVLPHPTDPTWIRALLVWPQVRAAAADHRAHVLILAIGTRPRLQTARILSAVTGALLAGAPGASGVLWDGRIARPAELWLTMSRTAFAPYPDYPFTLWVDIVPFRSGSGVGAVTMGLSAFAGREIEFDTDGAGLTDLVERVAGLASYLIEHGPVVRDGNTVGESDMERLTVQHRTSQRCAGLPVYAIAAPARGGARADLSRMPTDREVASCVGLPPHDGGVLSSYIDGVRGMFGKFERSPDGVRAEAGDGQSARNVAGEVRKLRDAMNAAIQDGRLYAYAGQQ